MRNNADLALLLRQLATMLDAGVPFQQALVTLKRGPVRSWAWLVDEALEGLRAGGTLAEVLSAHERRLGPVLPALVLAGERTGDLPAMCGIAADLLELELVTRRQLIKDLTPPALVVAAAVVIGPVPLLVSGGPGAYAAAVAPPLLVIVATVAAVSVALRMRVGASRLIVERTLLGLPVLGRIVATDALRLFCRVMAHALSAGRPFTECVELAARGTGFRCVEQLFPTGSAFDEEWFERGLARFPGVPASVVPMCRTGATAGKLDRTLGLIADQLEHDNRLRRKNAVKMAALLALVAVGVWVGFNLAGVWVGWFSGY